jgi:hypothetical protein
MMVLIFFVSIVFFVVCGLAISYLCGVGTKPSPLGFIAMLCLVGFSNCVTYYLGGGV